MAEIIFVLIFALIILCYIAAAIHDQLEFDRKWPPIDDDEFLRRCSPGTRRETALKVRRIISKQLGVPYDQIYPEQHFVNDLNC